MPEWYATAWHRRKSITISSQIVEGNEPLFGFPLEVRRTDPDFAKHVQPNGDDLLFTAADGQTKLCHEIRHWDHSAGRLVAVVKIPRLSPTDDTVIFLYYGNPACSNQQDVAGRWSEYEYQQYFLRDPQSGSSDAANAVHQKDGTPAYTAFLEAQKQVLEELFGREWLESANGKKGGHPAAARYQLCDSLLLRNGMLRLPDEQDRLPELAKLLLDGSTVARCSRGRLRDFSIGSIANYGDAGVLRRIRSEVRSASKYQDIQTELQWASWHLGQGHRVEAYE